MWWEALPPMIIITVALSIPQYAAKGIHTLMFGNPYRRDLTECFDRTMFVRDARIGDGSPYNHVGLEGLSD